tara:strand:+ start:20557 stop:20871 length:315 start_codon:yes stop_codon:yes gene_type:complete
MNRYIRNNNHNGVLKTEPSLSPPDYPDDYVEVGDRVKVNLLKKDQWFTVNDITVLGGSTIYSISNDHCRTTTSFDLIKEIIAEQQFEQNCDYLDYDADTPDEYW